MRLNRQEIIRIAQRLRRPKGNPQQATSNSASAVIGHPSTVIGRPSGREVNPQQATRNGAAALPTGQPTGRQAVGRHSGR
jgi:hypothetical protein